MDDSGRVIELRREWRQVMTRPVIGWSPYRREIPPLRDSRPVVIRAHVLSPTLRVVAN